MSTKTALIIGATGQTGGYLLKELLASPHFSKVGEYGRRVTAADALAEGKGKLEQKTIDFENLSASGLKEGKWDVVYITLGTTRKNAGSAEKFEKIDREYVVNAAREARVEGLSQRIVYLSSSGASATSPFLYPKSKGLTEIALAKLGYEDTIIFRPGMLVGTKRPEFRLAESLEIKVETLGKAIATAGILGSQALPAEVHAGQETHEGATFTSINNAGALALAKADA
ncbi:hypothetical protein BD626DRAFT_573260 [Schizophyllum amplum]|uniref:NAD(P)-binding domain-containing protein n=1 Tax=Schizophyllum amplum TaxID=97359 RepID=A0A550C1R7_9AGAR|nr:hypothetical protein BD626DRAFT_573260 [Auriculariopsis ampla]